MYSVVLMAALTTGSSSPDGLFCGHHGHHGCYGGISSTCYGCYGGMYYGTWGCAGYNGCFGCYGGSWGWGGDGGGPAIDYNCYGCHGCYGCYGGFGCTGFTPYGAGAAAPELIAPPKVEEKKGSGGSGSLAPDRAKVIVSLPADVKLYVDDQQIKVSSDKQTFSTPRLDRGQTYYYEVRAEAIRDGKTVVESKHILLKAGEEINLSFPKLDKEPTGIAATENRGR